MPDKPKVVSIKEDAPLIAEDRRTRRFILGVGKRRIAFDFATTVTELTEGTGDRPAPVLPINENERERPE